MTSGEFRDGHPRATLTLLGDNGPLLVEFVADTGFEGDLALPGHIARQLGNRRSGLRARALAV